ncbi:hypothetical protein SOV_32880 [Sporomusa ovata DSM 2662]|uniref:DUF1657 domain-containing protein n=1 Tax=Sporomusa ovata TaxID=2378 RepID=A0A0U1L281_9FIRM|nr:DUF1657 domain-containing protein [Sporomusa ovata]EQB25224.1 hypothetical protein DUF1657 [Sporomusa ovata DSM 2662]CQR73787.1 hypothetical protein SpAn4DRAFT_0249 [Sporomusa ovata]
MTVGMKVHQALGMLKTLSGNFHSFAMDTQDPQAKQMFQNFSKQMDQISNDLTSRLQYIEGQEPQYAMENMTQQQASQQQDKQQQMRLQ